MNRTHPISGKLLILQKEIQAYADEFGLDYFPQVFEVCDYDTINILAAQEGFPTRYPHWRFGMPMNGGQCEGSPRQREPLRRGG